MKKFQDNGIFVVGILGDDEFTYKLTYNYPPREDGRSMQDGLSNVAFEKENVEQKLKEKVRRNNNLTVEVQGSIIITSK